MPAHSTLLTAREAQDDLTELAREIARRHSYFALRRDAFASAVENARAALQGPTSAVELGAEASKVMAALRDGHARIAGAPDAFMARAYAPCLFGSTPDGLVAFHEDRRGFIDEECPYVRGIDGDDVGEWLEAALAFVPADTQRAGALRAAKLLRFIGSLRAALVLPGSGELRLELRNRAGTVSRSVLLPLSRRKPLYGRCPDSARLVPAGIGYLRIERCSADLDDEAVLHARLSAVRRTRGLIIDLRDNGGGSRLVVKTLLPYLMAPDEPPAVVTAALYRLQPRDPPSTPDGYLADRFMHPATSAVWTPAEQAAVRVFLARFAPRWVPPTEQGFSDVHVMAVSRPPETPFWYRQPVVVLVDEGCYSATEILLAALKERPGVTLVGACSGGGSGRPRGFTLPRSRLRVKASTMVSYRSDGTLIQGRGIEPDEQADRAASDFLGRTDHVLARAVSVLTSKIG